MGTGRLDSHALLSWPFREPGVTVNQTAPFDILAVAFATRDVDGEWEIDQQYGRLVSKDSAGSLKKGGGRTT